MNQHAQITTNQVGVVVIGRNEGARLTRRLASVQKYLPAVVYVDSDSSDGSQALAGSLGFQPLELDAARPAIDRITPCNDSQQSSVKPMPL